ncbi:transcription factor ovo-like homolog lin-48 [Mya arenaria]|nr:transcription factor ovo-like homolog lin-48 [Mya arenaria]
MFQPFTTSRSTKFDFSKDTLLDLHRSLSEISRSDVSHPSCSIKTENLTRELFYPFTNLYSSSMYQPFTNRQTDDYFNKYFNRSNCESSERAKTTLKAPFPRPPDKRLQVQNNRSFGQVGDYYPFKSQFSPASLPSSPTSPLISPPQASTQRLQVPGVTSNIELINGGFGVKNPLLSPDCCLKEGSGCRDAKFKCRICCDAFEFPKLLQRHLKTHSDVKRYLCTFCGKGFNDTFDLKRHTRTHTGVRPYKCEHCEKAFTQRCSLESHCRKIHGLEFRFRYKERRGKMYVCEDCGHVTHHPETHFTHIKESHPYNPTILRCFDKRHFNFSDTVTS